MSETSETNAQPTTTVSPRKWGAPPASNPNAVFVKTRSLVGTGAFTILSVKEGNVKDKAGVPHPSYIFELSGDRLITARKDASTIGKQVARDGMPPTGLQYEVRAVKPTNGKPSASSTGDSLVLVQL